MNSIPPNANPNATEPDVKGAPHKRNRGRIRRPFVDATGSPFEPVSDPFFTSADLRGMAADAREASKAELEGGSASTLEDVVPPATEQCALVAGESAFWAYHIRS